MSAPVEPYRFNAHLLDDVNELPHVRGPANLLPTRYLEDEITESQVVPEEAFQVLQEGVGALVKEGYAQ